MTTATQLTALSAAAVRTAYFVEFQFLSATVYLSSMNKPLAWGAAQAGTAQAGAATTLTLAAAASAVDSTYNAKSLHLTDGTDRRRKITGYVGATRVATVEARWQTSGFTWSEDFTSTDWAVGDVANPKIPNSTDVAAPDGTFTACKWVLNNNAGNRSFGQTCGLTATPAATNVFTSWVYVPSSNSLAAFGFYMFASGDVPGDPVDLNALPRDQWMLVSYTHTWGGGASGAIVPNFHYNGAGTIGDKIYVWHPVIVQASVAGDYVKTTSAIVALPSATTTYEVEIDWIGLGTLGAVDPIEESDSIDAKGLSFTLNHAQPTWLAAAVGPVEEYRGRNARLYCCPLNENFQLIDAPELCWRGIMDTMSIGMQGETGQIILRCETSAYGLKRRQPLRINAAQQKKRHPADTGLDYLTSLIAQPQLWLSKRFQQR